MKKEEALKLMESSTNVIQWNNNRETIKESCTKKQWAEIYPLIDTEGLIVKTLKKNRRKLSMSKN